MTGGIRSMHGSLAGALLLLLATACQGSSASPDSAERTAAAYSVIIDDLLRRQPIEPAEGSEFPVVYIEAFSDEGISLEVQVLVVANLAEQLEIRFIDDVVEATDQDLEMHPVKPGSALIGVGPVPEAPVEVQVEWYNDRETVMAYRYALTPSGGSGWTINGERASTEPVGFVQPSWRPVPALKLVPPNVRDHRPNLHRADTASAISRPELSCRCRRSTAQARACSPSR